MPCWTLHTEATAPRAIYDAINGAKRVVNVEFFGIADSGNGGHGTDALVDAAASRGGGELKVAHALVDRLGFFY